MANPIDKTSQSGGKPPYDHFIKTAPAAFVVFVLSLVLLKYAFGAKKRQKKDVGNLAVFITGCDSGMGYDCAKRLDKLGYKVFAGCKFPEGDGAKRLKRVSSERLTIVGIDVTSDELVCKALDYVRLQLPIESEGLYCLINNAGIKLYGDFDWYTMQQCENQVNVNLLGTIRVTKYFLPLLKQAQGRVITLTGINGRLSFPQLSIYSATKFALEGFCACLRYETEKFGIKISVIQPGDLSLSLSLLQSYKENSEEMWTNMSSENKYMYHDYFKWWKDQVRKASVTDIRLQKEACKKLLLTVEEAVQAENPKSRYISAPFPYQKIYTILGIMPESLRTLIIRFYSKRKIRKTNAPPLGSTSNRQRSATVKW